MIATCVGNLASTVSRSWSDDRRAVPLAHAYHLCRNVVHCARVLAVLAGFARGLTRTTNQVLSSLLVTTRPFRRPPLGSRKLAAAWRTASEPRPPRWALYDRHGIRRNDTLPQRVVANRKQEIYSGGAWQKQPLRPLSIPSFLLPRTYIRCNISLPALRGPPVSCRCRRPNRLERLDGAA